MKDIIQTMRAMVLKQPKKPLVFEEIPKPVAKEGELLIRVHACGVCRTDLHIQEGDLPHPKLPLILGHEIVGRVEAVGKNAKGFSVGDRVGVPWLGRSCGLCEFCKRGEENLCEKALFTGYDVPGGFAEYTTCRADFAIPLSLPISNLQVAPLLCAGLIGYRSYRKAAPQKRVGLYGFGVAAHLLAQLAVHEGKEVYAFTRKGDVEGQKFAKEKGAIWVGSSEEMPPKWLDAAIVFAPVGELVPVSLRALRKGGRCVCGGIHMSDIPSFPYRDLWGEKTIQSVANLTRQDAREYFSLLSRFPIEAEVAVYPLEEANRALEDFKRGKIKGAAVLQQIGSDGGEL